MSAFLPRQSWQKQSPQSTAARGGQHGDVHSTALNLLLCRWLCRGTNYPDFQTSRWRAVEEKSHMFGNKWNEIEGRLSSNFCFWRGAHSTLELNIWYSKDQAVLKVLPLQNLSSCNSHSMELLQAEEQLKHRLENTRTSHCLSHCFFLLWGHSKHPKGI